LSLYIEYRQDFDRLLQLARQHPSRVGRAADVGRATGSPLLADGALRQEIARSYIDLEILRLHGWRALSEILHDKLPGAEVSPAKVHWRSEEHTSELQSPDHLVCRLLLEKKKKNHHHQQH